VTEHTCTSCARDMDTHTTVCGECNERHFPDLCCPGCDCRSYEDAHAGRSCKHCGSYEKTVQGDRCLYGPLQLHTWSDR
jgi:hypothetical protein